MQQMSSSFHNTSQCVWDPSDAFEAIQAMIQLEVEQGLWANADRPLTWCALSNASPMGVNSSWVIYQYKSLGTSVAVETIVEVLWPAAWAPPAPDVQGNLPAHFFGGGGTASDGSPVSSIDVNQHPAPAQQPSYKPCSECL